MICAFLTKKGDFQFFDNKRFNELAILVVQKFCIKGGCRSMAARVCL